VMQICGRGQIQKSAMGAGDSEPFLLDPKIAIQAKNNVDMSSH
jgi:hypothetical protein